VRAVCAKRRNPWLAYYFTAGTVLVLPATAQVVVTMHAVVAVVYIRRTSTGTVKTMKRMDE
jgi:hypothetical protein